MPTLSRKQNGDYIIRSQISGAGLCTWQVDNKKAIFLLRDNGYEVNIPDGAVTQFPVNILMELIDHKYVSQD